MMDDLSTHDQALLDTGAARWHRGTLIPVMRGGDDGDTGGDDPAGAYADTSSSGGDDAATEWNDIGQSEPSSSWSPDDPAFRDAVAHQARQQFEEMISDLGSSDYDEPDYSDFQLDPLSDDFGQQMAALIAQSQQQSFAQMRELLNPLLADYGHKQDAEGNQRIDDIVQDLANRGGDFTDFGKAVLPDLAENLFLDEAQQTYGAGPRAAESALTQAAKFVRAIESAAAEKAVEQYKNQLSTVGGARGIPQGSATGVPGGPRPTSIIEAGRRFAERHQAGTV